MKSEQLLKYGFVIPTREYIGGILAGLGSGIVTTSFVLTPLHRITNPWVWFLAIGCVAVGSSLARAAQRKRFLKNGIDEKQVA